jgi:hypothetical protein
MKVTLAFAALFATLSLPSAGYAAEDLSFYGDPPDEHHPWSVHDGLRPQPKAVDPGTFSTAEQPGKPPSDAVILFDGTDLSKWQAVGRNPGPARWVVTNGVFQVAPSTGDIRTKEEFGDCQLHIEWAELPDIRGQSQGRGNSGIFLMGLYEIQVLDSYHNFTYADGHAGALYGIMPPEVNPIRPPGEFQVFDIIFRRPIFKEGKLLDAGYVTVLVNGVLVLDHTPMEGPTGHMTRTSFTGPTPDKGPLQLQDHGNIVRFRNVWYRPLPPRAIEGGTDGSLTAEATMAKRKAIAAGLRVEAEKARDPANPLPELTRLMESLKYEMDPTIVQKVGQLGEAYIKSLKALPADQLSTKRDEVRQLNTDFAYVAKFKFLPNDFGPKIQIEQIIRDQRWNVGRRGG